MDKKDLPKVKKEILKLNWALDNKMDGIIINPGAYNHYSIDIRDAISSIKIPTIEFI